MGYTNGPPRSQTYAPIQSPLCFNLLKTRIDTRVEGPRKGSRKSKLLTTLSKLNSNMDFCYFIGIDIAKETLDWAVYNHQGVQLSTHTPNTLAGIKTALAEFKALPGWNSKLAVFCMEHTATADRGHLQCPFTSTTL